MVWHAARITPQPWDGVIEFYRHIEDRNDGFRPMRLLAKHIASRPYAASADYSARRLHARPHWGARFAAFDVSMRRSTVDDGAYTRGRRYQTRLGPSSLSRTRLRS